jgi:hypothetical protein
MVYARPLYLPWCTQHGLLSDKNYLMTKYDSILTQYIRQKSVKFLDLEYMLGKM